MGMAGKDSKDEPVNGARIAAEILNRMPKQQKERLLAAIQQQDPTIAARLQENVYHFDELADLNQKSVQALVTKIEERDLLLSLKTASTPVKERILSGVSERKRKILLDELAQLPPTPKKDVEDAQRRVMEKLEQLRSSGEVRAEPGKKSVWV